MSAESSKDVWDKMQSVAALIASVLVPLAVAFVGNSYSGAMKDSENRLKYVELAVSILRSEPSEQSAPLRAWAVDVLQKHAVVALSKEAQEQLKIQKFPTYDTGTSWNLEDSSSYTNNGSSARAK